MVIEQVSSQKLLFGNVSLSRNLFWRPWRTTNFVWSFKWTLEIDWGEKKYVVSKLKPIIKHKSSLWENGVWVKSSELKSCWGTAPSFARKQTEGSKCWLCSRHFHVLWENVWSRFGKNVFPTWLIIVLLAYDPIFALLPYFGWSKISCPRWCLWNIEPCMKLCQSCLFAGVKTIQAEKQVITCAAAPLKTSRIQVKNVDTAAAPRGRIQRAQKSLRVYSLWSDLIRIFLHAQWAQWFVFSRWNVFVLGPDFKRRLNCNTMRMSFCRVTPGSGLHRKRGCDSFSSFRCHSGWLLICLNKYLPISRAGQRTESFTQLQIQKIQNF